MSKQNPKSLDLVDNSVFGFNWVPEEDPNKGTWKYKNEYKDKDKDPTPFENPKVEKNKAELRKRLTEIFQEINSKLLSKEFREKHLHLFNDGSYEHNTEDPFAKLVYCSETSFDVNTYNLVGFLKSDRTDVNVSSRFGNKFLLKLISYSDGFLEMPDYGSIGNKGMVEWIMPVLWRSALQKAFRLGLPKQYVTRSEKLAKIRGNIDVNDYIKNRARDAKYLCHYREHDYNNPVNRLISLTFSKIKQKNLISNSLRIRDTFSQATYGNMPGLIKALSAKHLSNPYYHDYNRVIDLSKSILRKELGDINTIQSETSAFFFDISMLFEYFVRKVLEQNQIQLFPPKIKNEFQISRGLFNQELRELQPDIIVKVKNSNKIDVFDVKYKRFDFKKGVKREDLFQMHTYVGNMLNKYKIRRCGFIYPLCENEWEKHKDEHENGIIKNKIKINKSKEKDFWIVFFKVPQDENKDLEYEESFSENLRSLAESFH